MQTVTTPPPPDFDVDFPRAWKTLFWVALIVLSELAGLVAWLIRGWETGILAAAVFFAWGWFFLEPILKWLVSQILAGMTRTTKT